MNRKIQRIAAAVIAGCLAAEPVLAVIMGPRQWHSNVTTWFSSQALSDASPFFTQPSLGLQRNLFSIATRSGGGEWKFHDDYQAARSFFQNEEFFVETLEVLRSQLNAAFSRLPEYRVILRSLRVLVPGYLQKTLDESLHEKVAIFAPSVRRIVVNTQRLLQQIMYMQVVSPQSIRKTLPPFVRIQVSMAVHDYGHVVDANGGIVWVSRSQRIQLERRESEIMDRLKEPEQLMLRGVLGDQRAEVYRRHISPQAYPDHYGSGFYLTASAGRFDLAIAPSRSIELAECIAFLEHAQEYEKAADLMRRFVDPLKDSNEDVYRTSQTIIAFVRDYRNAHRYQPRWWMWNWVRRPAKHLISLFVSA